MKLSRFNLWVKDYPKKGEHLLFNTRTQALIKVNQDFKRALDNLKTLHPSVQRSVASPKGTPYNLQPEDLQSLKENGIVVEDEAEDNTKLKNFFKYLKYDSANLEFEVTILTTYSCNFKCVYCFEDSVKEKVFMDKKTSDSIIEWLIKRAEKRNLKKIYLVYYGGEPLLNVRPIYDISWHMNEWALKNNAEFRFGIITNGSLIFPDLVDKFLTVGLDLIRISVDGDREAHDKKRPFANGEPSFDLIINNIKGIIDKVKVAITGNFDRENLASIPKLLDLLEAENILHKLDYAAFAPIVPRLGPKDKPSAIELNHCLSFFDKEGLFDASLEIKKDLIRRGVNIRSTGLAINACPLFMEDAGVTIDPKGIIYKCNSLVGYPEFSVGHVSKEEFNEKFHEFLDIDAWNKCPKDCPYVPMCQGGCRFFSYLENNNFTDLSCKREYFDRAVPELIKLEYDIQKAVEPSVKAVKR
ncbi:MAG: radical SAM protein [Candidatus Omnitrophota bacterium]